MYKKKETIVFDIDGTLTDYNKFIEDNAYSYFKKKYNLAPVDENELELEDIYKLDLNCREDVKKIQSFWIGPYFVKYSLVGKFRKEAVKCVKYFKNNSFNIEVHTSRAYTTEKNITGFIARLFTRLQLLFNGMFIPYGNIHFYKSDVDKSRAIIDTKPLIVFDDKKEILDKLSQNKIRTVCIAGKHNKKVEESKYIKLISDFSQIDDVLNTFFTDKDWRCIQTEIASYKFYKRIRFVGYIINWLFKPIVLNEENIINDADPIIYAPNHRSTLDPLIIESVLKRNIHWAALLRFFKGEDSIFNNSKNSFLCLITKWLFERLHFFPIDRKSDNDKANNYKSIRDMDCFLKNKYLVGIFPEGTTKRELGKEFGIFDSSFIALAKKNDAWIQPITTYWINSKNSRNKVVVNICEAFKATDMDKKDSYELYINEQIVALEENKRLTKE